MKGKKAEKHALLSNTRPIDKSSWIYWSCLIVGCGTILAYNFIISAVDFLGDLILYVQAAYISGDVIVTFLVMLCGHLSSMKSQILVSLILLCIMMLCIPFLTYAEIPHVQLKKGLILPVISGCVGCVTAILSCAFIGFCNHLPIKYLQISITGQTISGVIPGVLRIVFNAILKDQQSKSDIVYFCIGGVFFMLCVIVFLVISNTRFIAYYLQHKSVDGAAQRNILSQQSQHHRIASIKSVRTVLSVKSQSYKVKNSKKRKKSKKREEIEITSTAKDFINSINESRSETKTVNNRNPSYMLVSSANLNESKHNMSIEEKKNSDDDDDDDDDEDDDDGKRSVVSVHTATATASNLRSATYSGVWSKISKLVITQILIFFVTFLMYPGIIGAFCSSKWPTVFNTEWPVFFLLEFNVCDYIGRRYFASFTSFSFSKNNLWIACVWRIVMYPIFLLMYLGPNPPLKPNMSIIVIFTALLGITNGHFCCLCFIWAASLVEKNEQRICGHLMSWGVVMGIAGGTYFALLIKYLSKADPNSC